MKIKGIVVHISASPFGCVNQIDEWHKQRGFHIVHDRKTYHVGYNYIISNGVMRSKDKYNETFDGVLQSGRPLDIKNAAHTLGSDKDGDRINTHYAGICLISKNGEITESQKKTLSRLIKLLSRDYNIGSEYIYGHSELQKNKPNCPGDEILKFIKEIKKEIDNERI